MGNLSLELLKQCKTPDLSMANYTESNLENTGEDLLTCGTT